MARKAPKQLGPAKHVPPLVVSPEVQLPLT